LFTLLVAFLLTACTTPQAAPTKEPAETAPSESPPPTLEPTPTAEPTAIPPTDTPPPPEPTATPTAEPQPTNLFTFLPDPVVGRELSGQWDTKYINPGAVLFHEGQFHMFRNGFRTWPGLISIGYATSDDGRSWHSAQSEPVFTSREIPYAEQGADVSGVYVTDDGTWVLYFHTLGSSSVIGRATAPEPTGPWTADPEPVLQPGSDGAWDSQGIIWPSVVKTEEGLVMYFAGTYAFTTQIGRATSEDGLTWTKYDNPETTEPPFHESDPVLLPGDEWDGGDVNRPEARLTPEGWVMLFVGNDLNQRGLAFSDDGITWTAHPNNPVITGDQFPLPNSTTWDTALLYNGDTYFYYMEIGSLASTDIFVALHEGALRP
jgi:hypothetical protein